MNIKPEEEVELKVDDVPGEPVLPRKTSSKHPWSSNNIKILRKNCVDRGLKETGTKRELIARLQKYEREASALAQPSLSDDDAGPAHRQITTNSMNEQDMMFPSMKRMIQISQQEISGAFSRKILIKHFVPVPGGFEEHVERIIDPYAERTTIKNALNYVETRRDFELQRRAELEKEEQKLEEEIHRLRREQHEWEKILRDSNVRAPFEKSAKAANLARETLNSLKDSIFFAAQESKELQKQMENDTAKYHKNVSNRLHNEIELNNTEIKMVDFEKERDILKSYLETDRFKGLAQLLEEQGTYEKKIADLVNLLKLKKLDQMQDELKKDAISKALDELFQKEKDVLLQLAEEERLRLEIEEFKRIRIEQERVLRGG